MHSFSLVSCLKLIERLHAVHEEAYLSPNAGNRHDLPQLHVRVVLTECACHFVSGALLFWFRLLSCCSSCAEATVQSLYQLRGIHTYRDAHEYAVWSKRGDPVLHVELARWCDLAIVAPMRFVKTLTRDTLTRSL